MPDTNRGEDSAGDGVASLNVDDRFFAYQKQACYVGFGRVTQPVTMAKDFRVNGTALTDLKLQQPNLAHDKGRSEDRRVRHRRRLA